MRIRHIKVTVIDAITVHRRNPESPAVQSSDLSTGTSLKVKKYWDGLF